MYSAFHRMINLTNSCRLIHWILQPKTQCHQLLSYLDTNQKPNTNFSKPRTRIIPPALHQKIFTIYSEFTSKNKYTGWNPHRKHTLSKKEFYFTPTFKISTFSFLSPKISAQASTYYTFPEPPFFPEERWKK